MAKFGKKLNHFNKIYTPRHSGYGVLVAQLIQLVLMADFFWQYIKSIKTGMPMTLPIYVV
jgi:hypothetical protein